MVQTNKNVNSDLESKSIEELVEIYDKNNTKVDRNQNEIGELRKKLNFINYKNY